MFKRVDKQFLDEYAKDDYLLPIMQEEAKMLPDTIRRTPLHQAQTMIAHQWKRAIFHEMYHDLKEKRVLDIGGAYACYPPLVWENDYTLVEVDPEFFQLIGEYDAKVFIGGWEHFKPEQYDVVAACDVFLTNGRKIDEFLAKYLPVCKELRMTLTFRNIPKDGWTIEGLNTFFMPYAGRIDGFGKFEYKEPDLLPGNRNVYIIYLKGDI